MHFRLQDTDLPQFFHLEEGPFAGTHAIALSPSQPVDIAIAQSQQQFALYKLDIGSVLDGEAAHYSFLRIESLELIPRSIYTLYVLSLNESGEKKFVPIEQN